MTIVQLEALGKMANYNFILHCEETGFTAVIDPSELNPIDNELINRGWKLNLILNTHHHWDHTGGNLALQEKYQCDVVCHSSDRDRTPGSNVFVEDGDLIGVGKEKCVVIHIPGHTTGQVAFHFPHLKAAFVGDTLFNYGCGRVMEGTHEQMHVSLERLKRLPPDTQIYCGHEYTIRNLEFCNSMEPERFSEDLQLAILIRSKGNYTVPFVLKEQLKKNPFLSDSIIDFSRWREARDAF